MSTQYLDREERKHVHEVNRLFNDILFAYGCQTSRGRSVAKKTAVGSRTDNLSLLSLHLNSQLHKSAFAISYHIATFMAVVPHIPK